MANQFDLFRMAGGNLVLVLQSDVLDALTTRVVCLVTPIRHSPMGFGPKVELGDAVYRISPQTMATLTLAELGTKIGNLFHLRDEIVRSLDLLLTGV